MRNGKTLLRWMCMMVVLAVATLGCVLTCSAGENAAATPTLEATDSGAPSAMVMFPVSDRPNVTGAGMKPVVFNHLIHEKKISDCASCHHTGDTVACSSCHTVDGKIGDNGKAIPTLDQAMHQGGNGKPASCVSCHSEYIAKNKECAGCHALIQPSDNACVVCHSVPVTARQMQLGSSGQLPADENEALATKAVQAKKADVIKLSQVPNRVVIDTVADKYLPNNFTHARHVVSLSKRIEGSKLAETFHSAPATVCAACHHHAPASVTPSKCSSCHSKTIDPATPERPALKAAYHLQCMGCHNAMDVKRPQNTSCTTCHKERAE